MQQRYHIQGFSTHGAAVQERDMLLATNPKHSYQIRKRNKGLPFDLVRRVSVQDVLMNPEKIIKTRRAR